MEVQTVDIGDVRPYHRNPREHTSDSVDSLKDSILKFGFRVPVVLDADNTIITGHGRYKAVQELEGEIHERVDQLREAGRDDLADNLQAVHEGQLFAIHEGELDGRTVDEFRVSDNKVAEQSEWDFDALEAELEELDSDEPVGYEPEDLDNLIENYDMPEPELDEEDDSPLDEDDTIGAADGEDDPTVDLVCPECLETVEVDAEIAKREFEVLSDD